MKNLKDSVQKILIASDTHSAWDILNFVTKAEKPDAVIHLGDLASDAQKLANAHPDLDVVSVPGNCDGYFSAKKDTERVVNFGPASFFITHGHHYQVKMGLSKLISEGESRGVDAVLFGHTHQACRDVSPNGMWVINPGTLGGIHAEATYAICTIQDGTPQFAIKSVSGLLLELDQMED